MKAGKILGIRAHEYSSTPAKSMKRNGSGLSEKQDEMYRSRCSVEQDAQNKWMQDHFYLLFDVTLYKN